MESTQLIEQIQTRHKQGLTLTGLAALQYPAVQTKQLTFYNLSGGKKDYWMGAYHVAIKRTSKKTLTNADHVLFIAKHIEWYAQELDQIVSILDDVSLGDLKQNDKAWRIFAYLKKHFLNESIVPKKSIGRRYIELGDIKNPATVKDGELFVWDALFVPQLTRAAVWQPSVAAIPDKKHVEEAFNNSREYFASTSVRPLFSKFCRYASRLESAASAKIEGFDASVEVSALGARVHERMKRNSALRANLNMDNLHRDIVRLSKEALSVDFLCTVQRAIVQGTWKNEEERVDATPGHLRPFDEVIVRRGGVQEDTVVYVAPKALDVHTLLNELIEFYYASRATMHPLDLASIFKCQLVVIHPFGDGNGRLARWCFQYILIREGYLHSIHQAPISHIFLEEKDRYYDELKKVDAAIMDRVDYKVDPATNRYLVEYENPDMYRRLDYSPWLSYTYEAFARALMFSVEEHRIFERAQTFYRIFEKKVATPMSPSQQHEIVRAIDIGLRHEWGKKTEKRLENNQIANDAIVFLRESIDSLKK